MADDIAGQSVGSTSYDLSTDQGSSGLSGSQMLGLGALGIGAAGFGAILGQGESPLPGEFNQLQATVPGLQSQGSQLFGQGQSYLGQGQQALAMGQAGQLTGPQQAQLNLYRQGLQNQAQQTYASMGRNINQDTSGISTQAHIDEQVNAMSQQQIQSTIALGLGESQIGMGLSGQSLGFENAANQALVTAGNAQLQQDKDYSTALTGAFSSIATILGGAAKIL